MSRNIAVVATIATIAAGAAASLLLPHLRFSRKHRNPKATQTPKVEHVTDDDEDASRSEEASATTSVTASPRPAQSRLKRARPQSQPVLCAADVLSLLNTIAPRSHQCFIGSTQCTFCLEPVKGEQLARTTPCRHVFHSNCLEQWALHTTTKLMNAGMYTVARDGIVHYAARFPSCPNCSEVLDVIPRPVWTFFLLSAVTSALSLGHTCRAALMYSSGMVVRDDVLRALHVRIPLEERDRTSAWIESIDDDGSISSRDEESRTQQSGFTPLVLTPGMTRSEQRGFGRSDTRLAYAI
ncbi:unnamed protein product [Agarophyton chilense]|eukprot:gb/GEZJ01003917.1/.p2 GENE.gb/GEZJ01003917.1/~~gb/GEZJ01003917.1/.p2  ORF type:complete len:296 (+),score=29.55 gb/GEZJ01003917.1/:2637-3524(+)